jgi:hypothetical protein
MHAPADSITAFGFMTAILQVLEGIAWPWNQARHARTGLSAGHFRKVPNLVI